MVEEASVAGPPPRKERSENAARRREQLAEAALQSIIKNGLRGTTLATVAKEAGLSEGIAVFYFKTKDGLLAAALELQYQRYEANWREALANAGADLAERLAALVRSEFQSQVCSQEAQIVWHAFWGEAKAQPLFNDIADRYDTARWDTLTEATDGLLAELGRDVTEGRAIAAGIEALTDGLWLQMYLANGVTEPAEALSISGRFLTALFPERADVFEGLGRD